jgi:hypothetical protein
VNCQPLSEQPQVEASAPDDASESRAAGATLFLPLRRGRQGGVRPQDAQPKAPSQRRRLRREAERHVFQCVVPGMAQQDIPCTLQSGDPTLPNGDPTQSLSAHERIEDFLDHLCAPLVGVIPYRERALLREEARQHLECLIAEYAEQEATLDGVIEAAFREFGEPWRSGEEILREWRPVPSPKGARRLIRNATLHAFAGFGPLSVICLLLMERYTLYPGQFWVLPFLGALAFTAPLLAGIFIGFTAPSRAGQGTLRAVGLLAFLSLLVGLLLLPKTVGICFSLFQIGYWLPVGWVTATSTATSLRQYQRQHFLRPVRR